MQRGVAFLRTPPPYQGMEPAIVSDQTARRARIQPMVHSSVPQQISSRRKGETPGRVEHSKERIRTHHTVWSDTFLDSSVFFLDFHEDSKWIVQH